MSCSRSVRARETLSYPAHGDSSDASGQGGVEAGVPGINPGGETMAHMETDTRQKPSS